MSGDRWEPLVEFEVGPEDDLDPEFTRSLIPWEKEGGWEDSPPQPHILSQDIKTLPSPPKDARSTCPDRGTVSRYISQILTTSRPPFVGLFVECEGGDACSFCGYRKFCERWRAWWDSQVGSGPPIADEFEIPGVGERREPECGTFYKRLLCTNCGEEYQAIKRSCHNRRCSECWGDWLDRAVGRICERLLGYKEAVDAWYEENGRGRRLGNPKHLILSPPPSEWDIRSWEDVKRLRRKAKRLLRRLGVWGGVLIFHAYRIKPHLKELLKLLGRPYWELIREDVLRLGGWERYVYLSPHFHVVGYGAFPLRMKSSEFFEKFGGWVYKFKAHLSTEEDLERVVSYLLSHATFEGRNDCYTFFGNAAENCLVAEVVEKLEEELVCRKCNAPLVWEFYDGMRIPAVIPRVIKIYRFKRLAKAKGYG